MEQDLRDCVLAEQAIFRAGAVVDVVIISRNLSAQAVVLERVLRCEVITGRMRESESNS